MTYSSSILITKQSIKTALQMDAGVNKSEVFRSLPQECCVSFEYCKKYIIVSRY